MLSVSPDRTDDLRRKCLSEVGISDEMNLHIPQSIGAMVESRVLMRAATHIVGGQSNGPSDGIVQDGLDGSYILTNTWKGVDTDTMVTASIFYDCIEKAGLSSKLKSLLSRAYEYYPEYIGPQYEKGVADSIPGKMVASILFPPALCYTRTTETNSIFPKVVIKNGILLPDSGPLCKKTIGAKSNSIVHTLWKEYSPEMACEFLSNTQRLIDYWLPTHGFSMSMSDCVATSKKQVAKELVKMQSKVGAILGRCGGVPGEREETEINGILNSSMNVGLKLANTSMHKGERNALNVMRTAGAKGSVVNLSQITSHVGQQSIGGERIPRTISGGTRCLPHFRENDNSPEARGFIDRSYLTGLKPAHAFFHAAAGREGVISTAMKTAETGYEHKKMGRKTDDLTVRCDLTVRDANGRIVQFMYGDDGLDPKKIVSVSGLDHPFFINIYSLSNRLNIEAEKEGDEKPRKLKGPEKDLLLGFIISGLPKMKTEVTELATNNARESLAKLLNNVKVAPSKIPQFCSEIRNTYERSKAQDGDSVGLVATSSIGEPATQLTLNTFHNAGVKGKDVSLGVPRLKEILNTTKSENQKKGSCTVYLKSEEQDERTRMILELMNKEPGTENERNYNEGIIEMLREENFDSLGDTIQLLAEASVGTFFLKSEMQYVPEHVDPETGMSPINLIPYRTYEPEWWVQLYKDLHGVELEPEHWVVIINLDLEKMFQYEITTDHIANVINQESGGNYCCIPSPNIQATIHIYCNFSEIKDIVSSKFDISETERSCITPENINFYTCRDVVIDYVKSIKISGIEGVKGVFPREEVKSKEWVLDIQCRAVNHRLSHERFLKILSLPNVDQTRTICDDMHAVMSALGIEAARKFLIEELSRVISFDGTYIDPRHIQILVDSMTHTGEITSIGRYGISRDVGPIAKIMFEQSVFNAVESAIFTEADQMNSTASSVMYGLTAKSGTGVVTIDGIERAKLRNKRKVPRKIIDETEN